MNPIRYGEDTRAQFDQETCRVLDALNRKFAVVDCQDYGKEWFVRVWKTEEDELPMGFFGKTAYDAAMRIAAALNVDFNDTKPI